MMFAAEGAAFVRNEGMELFDGRAFAVVRPDVQHLGAAAFVERLKTQFVQGGRILFAAQFVDGLLDMFIFDVIRLHNHGRPAPLIAAMGVPAAAFHPPQAFQRRYDIFRPDLGELKLKLGCVGRGVQSFHRLLKFRRRIRIALPVNHQKLHGRNIHHHTLLCRSLIQMGQRFLDVEFFHNGYLSLLGK